MRQSRSLAGSQSEQPLPRGRLSMFGRTGPTLTEQQLQRYEQDRQLLSEMLPEMRHLIHADGSGAVAEGPVEVDVGAGCWETVQIEIVFERDYPRTPPRVYETGGRWRPEDDRHIMDTHEFCLWLEHVDTPSFATVDDLRREILRLLIFLRDQFVYDDLGKRWPSSQWKHHAPVLPTPNISPRRCTSPTPACSVGCGRRYSARAPTTGSHAPAARGSPTAAATCRLLKASPGYAR